MEKKNGFVLPLREFGSDGGGKMDVSCMKSNKAVNDPQGTTTCIMPQRKSYRFLTLGRYFMKQV